MNITNYFTKYIKIKYQNMLWLYKYKINSTQYYIQFPLHYLIISILKIKVMRFLVTTMLLIN